VSVSTTDFAASAITPRYGNRQTLPGNPLGMTTAQFAIPWILQSLVFASVVIGPTSACQITSNAEAADVTLDEDVLKRVEEILDDVAERDPVRVAAVTV
jgi:aryl-alcohol dehydrogenase-like predicted oxidoreductase